MPHTFMAPHSKRASQCTSTSIRPQYCSTRTHTGTTLLKHIIMAQRALVILSALVGLVALGAARAVETHVEQLQQAGLSDGHSGRIPAVDAVDVDAYTGRWYQVSESL